MFIMLLVVNFVIALITCFIVARLFKAPVNSILKRIVDEDIYTTWSKYILFAIYVVGISGGVRVWDLEKYISQNSKGEAVRELTRDRWVLEIYQTIIGVLQSNAWMLLLFFIFALIAFVITKGMELRRQPRQ